MAGPSHLKPGEKGRIIARIGNLPVQGNVTERIEVVSNDPKRAKVILILQAQVAASLPLPSLVPRLDEHPLDPVIRK